jgi:hypothetical protein
MNLIMWQKGSERKVDFCAVNPNDFQRLNVEYSWDYEREAFRYHAIIYFNSMGCLHTKYHDTPEEAYAEALEAIRPKPVHPERQAGVLKRLVNRVIQYLW